VKVLNKSSVFTQTITQKKKILREM